jgi:hypothetical protein
MARRSAYWLFVPLALICATALSAEQLLFLGYDLRGLIERSHVGPASPPAEGLAYSFDGQDEELQPGGALVRITIRQREDFKLGYEISDLVQLVTPPTLARHRL